MNNKKRVFNMLDAAENSSRRKTERGPLVLKYEVFGDIRESTFRRVCCGSQSEMLLLLLF